MYDQRWEMAQWEKCLSFMHKDLSSNPTTMQKGWTWWHMLMVTTLGRQRHTDSCKSHRIDCLVSFRVGRRDLTSITKKRKEKTERKKKEKYDQCSEDVPWLTYNECLTSLRKACWMTPEERSADNIKK